MATKNTKGLFDYYKQKGFITDDVTYKDFEDALSDPSYIDKLYDGSVKELGYQYSKDRFRSDFVGIVPGTSPLVDNVDDKFQNTFEEKISNITNNGEANGNLYDIFGNTEKPLQNKKDYRIYGKGGVYLGNASDVKADDYSITLQKSADIKRKNKQILDSVYNETYQKALDSYINEATMSNTYTSHTKDYAETYAKKIATEARNKKEMELRSSLENDLFRYNNLLTQADKESNPNYNALIEEFVKRESGRNKFTKKNEIQLSQAVFDAGLKNVLKSDFGNEKIGKIKVMYEDAAKLKAANKTEEYNKKLIEIDDEWRTITERVATDYADYFEIINKRVGKNDIASQLNELEQKLNGRKSTPIILREFQNAKVQMDRAFYPYLMLNDNLNEKFKEYNKDTESNRLIYSAKKLLDNSKNTIEATKTSGLGGVWKGFKDGIFNLDSWLASNKLLQDLAINDMLKKVYKNEPLTDDEQLLADALVINLATQAYYAENIPMSYKAGLTTGSSIPFMVEFMILPYAKCDTAIGRGLGKLLAKKAGKNGFSALTKAIGKTVVGGIITPTIMTSTVDMPKVLAGVEEKKRGNVEFKYDPETGFAIDETKNDMRELGDGNHMMWNSYAEVLAGNASERFLEPMKVFAKGKITSKSKVAQVIDIFSNEIDKLKLTGHVGGYIEEFGEEMLGNLLTGIMQTDQTVADNFTKEQLEETFFGLMPMQIAIAAHGVGATAVKINKTQKGVKKILVGTFTDKSWNEFKELLKNDDELANYIEQTGNDYGRRILTIASDPDISADEKKKQIDQLYNEAISNVAGYLINMEESSESTNDTENNETETTTSDVNNDIASAETTENNADEQTTETPEPQSSEGSTEVQTDETNDEEQRTDNDIEDEEYIKDIKSYDDVNDAIEDVANGNEDRVIANGNIYMKFENVTEEEWIALPEASFVGEQEVVTVPISSYIDYIKSKNREDSAGIDSENQQDEAFVNADNEAENTEAEQTNTEEIDESVNNLDKLDKDGYIETRKRLKKLDEIYGKPELYTNPKTGKVCYRYKRANKTTEESDNVIYNTIMLNKAAAPKTTVLIYSVSQNDGKEFTNLIINKDGFEDSDFNDDGTVDIEKLIDKYGDKLVHKFHRGGNRYTGAETAKSVFGRHLLDGVRITTPALRALEDYNIAKELEAQKAEEERQRIAAERAKEDYVPLNKKGNLIEDEANPHQRLLYYQSKYKDNAQIMFIDWIKNLIENGIINPESQLSSDKISFEQREKTQAIINERLGMFDAIQKELDALGIDMNVREYYENAKRQREEAARQKEEAAAQKEKEKDKARQEREAAKEAKAAAREEKNKEREAEKKRIKEENRKKLEEEQAAKQKAKDNEEREKKIQKRNAITDAIKMLNKIKVAFGDKSEEYSNAREFYNEAGREKDIEDVLYWTDQIKEIADTITEEQKAEQPQVTNKPAAKNVSTTTNEEVAAQPEEVIQSEEVMQPEEATNENPVVNEEDTKTEEPSVVEQPEQPAAPVVSEQKDSKEKPKEKKNNVVTEDGKKAGKKINEIASGTEKKKSIIDLLTKQRVKKSVIDRIKEIEAGIGNGLTQEQFNTILNMPKVDNDVDNIGNLSAKQIDEIINTLKGLSNVEVNFKDESKLNNISEEKRDNIIDLFIQYFKNFRFTEEGDELMYINEYWYNLGNDKKPAGNITALFNALKRSYNENRGKVTVKIKTTNENRFTIEREESLDVRDLLTVIINDDARRSRLISEIKDFVDKSVEDYEFEEDGKTLTKENELQIFSEKFEDALSRFASAYINSELKEDAKKKESKEVETITDDVDSEYDMTKETKKLGGKKKIYEWLNNIKLKINSLAEAQNVNLDDYYVLVKKTSQDGNRGITKYTLVKKSDFDNEHKKWFSNYKDEKIMSEDNRGYILFDGSQLQFIQKTNDNGMTVAFIVPDGINKEREAIELTDGGVSVVKSLINFRDEKGKLLIKKDFDPNTTQRSLVKYLLKDRKNGLINYLKNKVFTFKDNAGNDINFYDVLFGTSDEAASTRNKFTGIIDSEGRETDKQNAKVQIQKIFEDILNVYNHIYGVNVNTPREELGGKSIAQAFETIRQSIFKTGGRAKGSATAVIARTENNNGYLETINTLLGTSEVTNDFIKDEYEVDKKGTIEIDSNDLGSLLNDVEANSISQEDADNIQALIREELELSNSYGNEERLKEIQEELDKYEEKYADYTDKLEQLKEDIRKIVEEQLKPKELSEDDYWDAEYEKEQEKEKTKKKNGKRTFTSSEGESPFGIEFEDSAPITFDNGTIYSKKDGEVFGWYANGVAHIYMPNIKTPEQLGRTIAHEFVAHKGLAELFGDRYMSFCDRVWNAMSKDNRANFVEYAKNNMTEEDTAGMTDEEKMLYTKRVAAQEYLAKMAEDRYDLNGVNMSIFEKAIAWLRRQFRKFYPNLKLNDNDLALMLYESKLRLGGNEMTPEQQKEFDSIYNYLNVDDNPNYSRVENFSKETAPRIVYDRNNTPLAAIHNIAAGNLRKVIQLGGFANPSVAVIDSRIPYNKFGEISLVFPSESLEGQTTFTGDAYTPDFPWSIKVMDIVKLSIYINSLNIDDTLKQDILEAINKDDVNEFYNLVPLLYVNINMPNEFNTIKNEYLHPSHPGSAYNSSMDIINKHNNYKDYNNFTREINKNYFDNYFVDKDNNYIPVNLENASKIMNENEVESYNPFSYFMNQIAKKLYSKKEIKDNQRKIKNGKFHEIYTEHPREAYDSLDKIYNDYIGDSSELEPKEYAKKLIDLMNVISDTYNKSLENGNEEKEKIEENVNKAIGLKNGINIQQIQQINYYANLIKDRKREYFETKFNRPVRLNEIISAVVPYQSNSDIINALEKAGIQVHLYDPDVEGDFELVQELATDDARVLFSKDTLPEIQKKNMFSEISTAIKENVAPQILDWWHRIIETYQNRDERFRLFYDELKEAGVKLGTDKGNDFYRKAIYIRSKSIGAFKQWRYGLMKDFIDYRKKLIGKGVLSASESSNNERLMDLYMYARDYKERMDNGNEGYKDNFEEWFDNFKKEFTDGSLKGMKDVPFESIDAFIDWYEQTHLKGNVNEFWSKWKATSDYLLDHMKKHKVITQEEYDTYKSRQYYVPQRYSESVTDEEGNVDTSRRMRAKKAYNAIRKANGISIIAHSPVAHMAQEVFLQLRDDYRNEVVNDMFDVLYGKDYDEETREKIRDVFAKYGWEIGSVYNFNESGEIIPATPEQMKNYREAQKNYKEYKKELAELKREQKQQEKYMKSSNENLKQNAAYVYDELQGKINELNEKIKATEEEFDKYRYVPENQAVTGKNSMIFRRDGMYYVIRNNGNDPISKDMSEKEILKSSEDAMQVFDRHESFKEIKGLYEVTKWASSAYTSLNPLFALNNIRRDVTSSLARSFVKDPHLHFSILNEYRKIFSNLKALSPITQYIFTNTSNDPDFNRYVELGGSSGFALNYGEFDKAARDYEEATNGMSNGRLAAEYIRTGLSYFSELSEIAVRYAVYKGALAAGYTEEQAIAESKELSLNFDVQGKRDTTASQWLFSAVPFVNPAIQSLEALVRIYKGDVDSVKGGKTGATIRLMSLGLINTFIFGAVGKFVSLLIRDAIIGALGNGDDDDDELLESNKKFINLIKTSTIDQMNNPNIYEVDDSTNGLLRVLGSINKYADISYTALGNWKSRPDQREMALGIGFGSDLGTLVYMSMLLGKDNVNVQDFADILLERQMKRMLVNLSPVPLDSMDEQPVSKLFGILYQIFNGDSLKDDEIPDYLQAFRSTNNVYVDMAKRRHELVSGSPISNESKNERNKHDWSPETLSKIANTIMPSTFRYLLEDIYNGVSMPNTNAWGIEKQFFEDSRKKYMQNINYSVRELKTQLNANDTNNDIVKDAADKALEFESAHNYPTNNVNQEFIDRIQKEYNDEFDLVKKDNDKLGDVFTIHTAKGYNEAKAAIQTLETFDIRKLAAKAGKSMEEYLKLMAEDIETNPDGFKQRYLKDGILFDSNDTKDILDEYLKELDANYIAYYILNVEPIVNKYREENRAYNEMNDEEKKSLGYEDLNITKKPNALFTEHR